MVVVAVVVDGFGNSMATCLHHVCIMIASCLPWCLLMLFTLPTLDALICAMCTMFFSQDQTCKWPLNENWLQYNACRVYQPSMHAQRLFWTFSPFPTLGIPTPFAIRRAQWRRTWSASGWPGNPVATKNGDTSVGTKKWGYLWTYTYIIYQLIVIWFIFFLGTFKVGKSWL